MILSRSILTMKIPGEMPDSSSQPLVSVICSTYNSKATLRCALQSVLNQDFKNFEVWVIGDACTDGTEEVIKSLNDPRLHWHNFPKNSGNQSEPNNEGMRRARGKYFAFIGHDDLWMPWHLSTVLGQMEKSSCDIIHDLVANVGMNGIWGVHGAPPTHHGYKDCYFPTSSWLHRRELFTEIGGWRNPETLGWPIDFDFTSRAARAGKKIEFVLSLGVLKFHSKEWKPYKNSGQAPQAPFLERILREPKELAAEILLQSSVLGPNAFRWSEKKPLDATWAEMKGTFRNWLNALYWRGVHAYGPDRWPVRPIILLRNRKARSKFRVSRGLPSLQESNL